MTPLFLHSGAGATGSNVGCGRRWRPGTDGARYTLANGRGAHFADIQNLGKQEYIVAVDLDDRERDARILLAAPLKARLSLATWRQRLLTHPDLTPRGPQSWTPFSPTP